ncbi:MAG TPA: pirin family protein [Rhizomicrobium sp.]|nr:pirin family protein [Rhizomicrobium sp.]
MENTTASLAENPRPVLQVTEGQGVSDGAGVRMTRLIGTPKLRTLDPFLMLDFFSSDAADEYLAGFPNHPHRGFETVTYMLAGRMRHKDNHGHEGVIEPGGIQWMTAGRGVIHSEMPEQTEGLMKGFQLWVNLPARLKMTEPAYSEFGDQSLPVEKREGAAIKVLAGKTALGTTSPVADTHVGARYFDVTLTAGASFREPSPSENTAAIVLFEGAATIGGRSLASPSVAVLGEGDTVEVIAGADGARFLFLSGKPLREPVAWAGPFVMNNDTQLRQAFADYQAGRF